MIQAPAEEKTRPTSAKNGGGWRSDWKFLIIFGVALVVITSLPYAFGYLSSPPDKQYMGLDYTVYDYAQYMSWARESAHGILIQNKLTPEVNPPAFFNLLWWIVGRSERYLHLSFIAANQILRVISAALFMAVTYTFCAAMFADRLRRRFAFVLACLATGFGWVLVVVKHVTGTLGNPTLVYNSPGNTFLGMMEVPHQILSAAILVAMFLLVLRGYQENSRSRLALAGFLGLILGLEHTYDLVTAYAVVAAFAILLFSRDGLRGRWLTGLALFYGISAPAPLYWAELSRASAQWREVLAQYRNLGVFTPDPVQLLVLLGPTFIVALLTFRGFVPLAKRTDEELFLSGWFVVVLFLIYLPVNFQIMMLNGFQVALAVLATRGLTEHVIPWANDRLSTFQWFGPNGWLTQQRLASLILASFLVLVLPTTLYLFSWRFVALKRHEYPNYLYCDDVAALNWLDQHTQPSDAVLSSLSIGIYIPGLTGAHAFLAHGADTLSFVQKRAMVARFFDASTPDDERLGILQEYRVRYVFYGNAERALGSFDPATAEYLERVFTSPNTQIYRVKLTRTATARQGERHVRATDAKRSAG